MHGRVSLATLAAALASRRSCRRRRSPSGTWSSTRARRPARVPPTAAASRRCRAGRSNRPSPRSSTARRPSSRSRTARASAAASTSSPAARAARSRPPRRRSTSAWPPPRSTPGKVSASLSALIGGYDGQDDQATVAATPLNASGIGIAPATTLGPVTQAERAGGDEPAAALDDLRGAVGDARDQRADHRDALRGQLQRRLRRQRQPVLRRRHARRRQERRRHGASAARSWSSSPAARSSCRSIRR